MHPRTSIHRTRGPAFGLALAVIALVLLSGGRAVAQPGVIILESPSSADSFRPGDQVAVLGRVVNFSGAPIIGVNVTARVLAGTQVIIAGIQRTVNGGFFGMGLLLPSGLADGTYRLEVTSDDPEIQGVNTSLRVENPIRNSAPPAFAAVFISTLAGALIVPSFLVLSARRARNRER